MFRVWHKRSKCYIGGMITLFQDGSVGRWSSNAPFDFFKEEDVEVIYNTDQTDEDGNPIYGGDTVRQISVVIGSCDIDFTGEVKFYDGTWYIDDGFDSLPLFNETCELENLGVKFKGEEEQ